MTEDIATPLKRKHAHPIVYMFLVLPFGIGGGYVSVALAFLFGNVGISIESISFLSTAALIINVAKFLWAPVVDSFLTLKKWYLLSCTITAITILGMGFFPIKESSIVGLIVLICISNIASSFIGITVSGLAAHDIPEEMKGRLSGYYNAGNLGGSAFGGGLGLWIAENTTHLWLPVAVLAIICILCCFGLIFVKEYPSTIKDTHVGRTMLNLLKDIWNTLKVRAGILAMILCFLPLGTGAAQNLWAAVAGGWNASAHTVELVTGIASGFITIGGCLIGGWICERTKKQMAYVVFGLMGAICAFGMAYSPHTQFMYIIWTSLYAFILGLSYSAFSAFVFEVIGKGAAGTKYTILASLANAPIALMTFLDGWAYTHYGKIGKGPEGMLDIEALAGVVGIAIFLFFIRILKEDKKTKSPA